jgi:hypothetical protein
LSQTGETEVAENKIAEKRITSTKEEKP